MPEQTASSGVLPLLGGCVCAAIRYELDAPIERLVNCHCQFCRRAHGAAFVTTSPVPSRCLRITRGEEQLARREGRFFCRECATRLFNRASAHGGVTALIVTTLDIEPSLAPSAHLNLESKAPWYEILDEAPRFDGFPPNIEKMLEGSD